MNFAAIIFILGWVLLLEAIFMVFPCIVAIIYQEPAGWAFLIIALVCAFLGFLATRKRPTNLVYYAREGFVTVALSWIIMSIFGALPFVINGDIPSFTDALFETISGFTTTGASALTEVESLKYCSLFWRSFTHWIGGMGVFVFLLAVLPLTGGYNMHLMKAESPGPSVGKLVPKVKETAKILYGIYIFMTVAEIVLLLIAGMPVFDAITTSLGTAGTGGFGIKNDSMMGYNIPIQAIVTIFMILFGVNFNFYYFLLGKHKKNAFKMEEVHWYFIIISACILIITMNVYHIYDNVFTAFHHSAFQVGSIITTTGFATADFNTWPQVSRTILVVIMFIGACAGSTGGGIKVSRIIILAKSVKQEMLTFIHPRSVKVIKFDKKGLDQQTVKSVSVFLVTYILIFGGSMFLLAFDNLDLITNFTSVTATLNNIGPGLEIVGPCGNYNIFSPFAKYVLMFDMLAGRLELYPILLLFTPSVWKKN